MARAEDTDEQRLRKFKHLPEIDKPVAGYYRVRLVKRGPYLGARIWFGEIFDPNADENVATYGWKASRNGILCDVNDLWPWCYSGKITFEEYRELIDRQKSPNALDPKKSIDLNQLPVISF